MKKHVIITLLLFSAIVVSHAQTAYLQKKSERVIVTPEVEQKLLMSIEQGKAYLIDVRTPEEYSQHHLKYAANINIKSADFTGEIKKLDKSKPIYLYCHSGNRSGRAADSLQTLGYHLSYNIGAIDSLTKAGFPVQ